MPPAATADALHEEDEDGPTMVASVSGFPKAAADDEATQVHPSHRFNDARSISMTGGNVAPMPSPLGFAGQPDPHMAVPQSQNFMAGVAAAEREAAMNAALAAAQGTDDPMGIDERRAQQLETATAALLGIGMTVGALAAYLSSSAVAADAPARSASYSGLTVICSMALFAAGMATLQRKQAAKLALVIGAGLLLMFALTRLFVIALS